MNWAIKAVVEAILGWITSTFIRLYNAYKIQKRDDRVNDSIQKGVEDAKSDEELQDALNRAGQHLGGH
jgi:hypothetical protein